MFCSVLWNVLMKHALAYFDVLLIVVVRWLAKASDSYIVFLPLSQESIHHI